MIIAGRYSFNGGADVVREKYPHLLREVETAITDIDVPVLILGIDAAAP